MPDEAVVVTESTVQVPTFESSSRADNAPTSVADRMIQRLADIQSGKAAAPKPDPDGPDPKLGVVAEAPKVEAEKPKEDVVPETPKDDKPATDDIKIPLDDEVTPVAEGDDADNPFDPKSKEGRAFKNLRLELKGAAERATAAEAARGTLESRIQELEALQSTWAEKEAALKEYEADSKVARLEASPEYRREVETPLSEIVKRSDEIADANGIDKYALTKALDEPDAAKRKVLLKDLLEGVDDEDKYDVRVLASKLDAVRAKETELRTNADRVLAEIKESREKEESAKALERVTARKEVSGKVAEKFLTKLPAALHDVIRGEVKTFTDDTDIDALDLATRVFNAQAGVALKHILADRNQLQTDLNEALAELEAYRKAQPTVEGSEVVPSSSVGNGGFLSRVNSRLGISA